MYAGDMPEKISMAAAEVDRFRQNLKVVCGEHGSIQEIAEAAEIHRVYLSRILKGDQVPSLEIAARIAEAAGLSLQDMLADPTRFAKKHGKKFCATA
jgi:transcriptional regulator with XRE-family HTH domain